MIALTLKEVAALCPGRLQLRPGAQRITGVQVDSRRIDEGDLFVAIGPGADYAKHAFARGAAAVLVPVDLWFDRTPEGSGVAVLRLAMVDGRVGEIRWIGDIRSAPSNTFSRDLLTSLAAHTADLIAAP